MPAYTYTASTCKTLARCNINGSHYSNIALTCSRNNGRYETPSGCTLYKDSTLLVHYYHNSGPISWSCLAFLAKQKWAKYLSRMVNVTWYLGRLPYSDMCKFLALFNYFLCLSSSMNWFQILLSTCINSCWDIGPAVGFEPGSIVTATQDKESTT